jgi:hypothetical protein
MSLPMGRVQLLSLICLSLACGEDSELAFGERARPDHAPVLILAVDGLEWDEALPLLREDELPTLAKLMAAGRFGRLRSMKPTLSPIIWTTVATGKSPPKHGILGFGKTDGPGGPVVSVFNNLDRRTKAFWEILSDRRLRVAVIGWWLTYPADPVNGLMVAQVNTLDQAEAGGTNRIKGGVVAGLSNQVHPPDREPEILSIHDRVSESLSLRLREILGQAPAAESKLERKLWSDSRWAIRADATYLEIARACDPRSFDVVALYLGGIDVVGHRFWRYTHPNAFVDPPDAEAIESFGDLVPDYYRYVDRELGRLIEAYGEPVTVMVVSDHGMRATNTQLIWDPNGESAPVSGGHVDAPPGLVIVSGPGIRRPQTPVPLEELEASSLPFVGSVADVTPTLLAHLGVPVGRDMEGEVWWSVIERSADEAAVVPTHDDRAWKRNREQRRAEGIIIPAQDGRLEQLRALGYIE